jgi:hypothetical protein
MKTYSGIALAVLLATMLVVIDVFLGRRVVFLAAGFAAIWFAISFILLSRPPGIPEFVSEEPGGDEQYVVRRDVLPQVPLRERLSLSLTTACGACFLIWMTLALLSA